LRYQEVEGEEIRNVVFTILIICVCLLEDQGAVLQSADVGHESTEIGEKYYSNRELF
jgi:hypothetical protein